MIFLILLFPLFTGFLLISLLCPTEGLEDEPWKVAAGFGAGIGAFSLCFFFWAFAFGAPGPGFLGLQTAVLIGLAWLSYRRSRRRQPIPFSQAPEAGGSIWLRRTLILLCVVVAISAVATFAFLALEKSHGDWDAWALWNARARFFFRGGRHWTDAFSPITFHPDYPLLLPSTVSGLWLLLGGETTAAPMALAFAFFLATSALLTAALHRLRGDVPALLSLLVLLSCPFFLIHSTSQYADLPLGFFFLATTAMLAFAFHWPEGRYRYLAAAGLFASLGTWTKNEGQLFMACLMLAYLVWIPNLGLRRTMRDLACFALGGLPVLLTLLFFKLRFAPPNDLMSSFSQATLGKLQDGSRYRNTATVFFRTLRDFGQWRVNFPLGMALYFLLVGSVRDPAWRKAMLYFSTAAVLTAVGYFFIYITTPMELMWHLATSLARLYFQLWPSFVFLFFLYARLPWDKSAFTGRWAGLKEA